jgi:PAS domain S-box-containing protein
MRILLIEDNPGDIRLLQEYLKEGSAAGWFQITQAGRLSMGLERLAEARFDAVLLDLSLPDSQGLDTLVRLHGAEKDVPIVVLTGIEDEALGVKLVQAGAQDYLVKGSVTGPLLVRSLRYAAERQRAEGALRESEERLRAIMDNSPAMIFLKDAEGRYLQANRTFVDTLRFKDFVDGAKMDLIGKTDEDIFSPEQAVAFRANDQKVLEVGRPMEFEEVALHHDGPHTSIVVKFPLFNAHGQCYALCGITTDITERKRTEEEIRRSKTFVTSIVENLPSMIFVKGAKDLKFVRFNKAGEDLLGHSREVLIGKSDYDLFPKEEADFFTEKDRQVFETGDLVDIPEEAIETKHQGLRILHTRKIPIYDETGEPQYLLGISEDITDRKRAEAALKASETRFRAIFDQTFQFIGLMKTDGTLIEANWSALQFAGIREEDVLGKLFWDTPWWTHSPELQNRLREAVRQAAGGTMVRFEATHPRPTGELAYVDFSLKPVRDEHGNVTLLIPEGRDITERKQVEAALRESEERYRSIFESAVEGIFQTTLDGKYVAVNPALARMYGYDSPKDMIAAITNIASQLYVDPGRRNEFIRLMQEQETVNGFEALVYRKDGSFIWISESVRELRDRAGVLVGYEGTVEHITQRKLAEQRLRDMLDQVRMLSGRVATVQEEERTRIARELHDELGVGLTCLKIDLSRLHTLVGEGAGSRARKKVGDKIRSMVEQIDTTIASVQRLVTELRPALLDDLGLVAAIEWQCHDFQKRTDIPCTCVTSADDIAMEPARATALFRICQEALTNTARHAQATAVTVTLESWNNSLRLVVADNGVGIPDTKVSNHHSLGLIGMQERVALFGGEITIQGHPEKGTTVTACLPRCLS